LFLAFPTGVQAHERGVERKSTVGVAHIGVIIVASLAGILFGFDTAVIVGITRALCKISSRRDRARSHRGLERMMRHHSGTAAALLGVALIMAGGAASAWPCLCSSRSSHRSRLPDAR
jgi:hypothetical protein